MLQRSGLLLALAILTGCGAVPTFDTHITRELPPCPEAPRCVSSQSAEPDSHIAPLAVHNEFQWQYLQQLLIDLPRTRVIAQAKHYLHVEQHSAIMGYRDDVQLLYQPCQQRVDIRSAARIGYYDFQVNRQRIENIRLAFLRRFAATPILEPAR